MQTTSTRYTVLTDRASLAVRGSGVVPFLQGVLTNHITVLEKGTSLFSALLTAQGKILCDMILSPLEDGFLLDCRLDYLPLIKERLTFYRLRAPVQFEDTPPTARIIAAWKGQPEKMSLFSQDPRLPDLGYRGFIINPEDMPPASALTEIEAYHAHRMALGVPECGLDFPSATLFPHEANMDRMNGLSFTKGCYIGQEIVARMQHRAIIRKRIVPIRWEGKQPEASSHITSETRHLGILCSSNPEGQGLALLNHDRVRAALAARESFKANGSIISLQDFS